MNETGLAGRSPDVRRNVGTVDEAVSNAVARKGVWVRVPLPVLYAPVVQWQNTSFVIWGCQFDSDRVLQCNCLQA